MNKKIIVIIISSVILIISIFGILMRKGMIPGPEFLDNRNHRMHMQRRDHKMRGNRIGRNFCTPEFMRHRLHLQENLIKRIQKLNLEFNKEYIIYDQEKQPLRKELRKLLENKNREDLRKIRKLLRRIYEIDVELRMVRIRQGMEISKMLSPDQMKMLRGERKRMLKNRGRYFWQE